MVGLIFHSVSDDGVVILERRFRPDDRNGGMREERLDALSQLSHHIVLTRYRLAKVESVVRECHAHRGGVLHVEHQLGIPSQAFGGDTAHVQACAADRALLEKGDIQAPLRSIFSGAVAAWPRADDNQVILVHFSAV